MRFEPTTLYTARWVVAPDSQTMRKFEDANRTAIADDHDGDPVYLARNAWHLDKAASDFPSIRFLKTKEQVAVAA